MSTDHTGTPGLVVAAHGRRGILETDEGRIPYLVRGRRLRPVCGDRATWIRQANSADALLTDVAPRRNTLARWHEREAIAEPVAANLDQLLIVLAPIPVPDLNLLDHLLCAAELMPCRPLIAWNKAETAGPPASLRDELGRLGYDCLAVSAKSGEGLGALRAALQGCTTAMAGQSGVGKSSLTNALIPEASAEVGELSAGSGTGTHTTTAAVMRVVPGTSGGRLLDTPGVRSFLPATRENARVGDGFPEIRELAPSCQFSDCRHDREPRCAVKDAVASGIIPARRYASYRRIAGLA